MDNGFEIEESKMKKQKENVECMHKIKVLDENMFS